MSGRRLPPSTIPPPIGPDGYPPEVWATLAHDRSTGPVVAVTATCLFLAVLVVALRVYTRRVLLNSFGLDDWFAVFSLVRALHHHRPLYFGVPVALPSCRPHAT